MTIFSSRTALRGAFGGGLVKYKSEMFLVSVTRKIDKIRVELTCCDTIMPRLGIGILWYQYIHSITKTIELTMDTASPGIGEFHGS